MELYEWLILSRLYTLIGLIADRFGERTFLSLLAELDVDEVVMGEEAVLSLSVNEYTIVIAEEYRFRDYQLEIAHYSYTLSKDGEPLLSCDNSPHHLDVPTFPHHRHRYPKERFRPSTFSGKIEEFLDEVLWEMERP